MNALEKKQSFWEQTASIDRLKEEAELAKARAITDELQKQIDDIESQKTQTDTVTETLYGFKTTKEVERKTDIASLTADKEKASHFVTFWQEMKDKREAYIAALTQLGLKPIAVVSPSIISDICKRTNLLRFEHLSADGTARCYASKDSKDMATSITSSIVIYIVLTLIMSLVAFLTEATALSWIIAGSVVTYCLIDISFSKKIRSSVAYFALIGLLISLCMSIKLMPFAISQPAHFDEFLLTRLLMSVALFVIGFIAMCVIVRTETLYNLIKTSAKKITAWIYTKRMSWMSHEKLVDLLWPDKNDFAASTDHIEISFPRAPRSFVEKLRIMKENRLQPKIAVQQQAVMLDSERTANSIASGIERLELDPILYHSSNNHDFIAILGQFGRLPKEEEVLTWLKDNQSRQIN